MLRQHVECIHLYRIVDRINHRIWIFRIFCIRYLLSCCVDEPSDQHKLTPLLAPTKKEPYSLNEAMESTAEGLRGQANAILESFFDRFGLYHPKAPSISVIFDYRSTTITFDIISVDRSSGLIKIFREAELLEHSEGTKKAKLAPLWSPIAQRVDSCSSSPRCHSLEHVAS